MGKATSHVPFYLYELRAQKGYQTGPTLIRTEPINCNLSLSLSSSPWFLQNTCQKEELVRLRTLPIKAKH